MTISNVDTYTTTVFQIENTDTNESYIVTHREDGDEYFIPVWIIEDEFGDPVHGEVRTQLIEIAENHLTNKNK